MGCTLSVDRDRLIAAFDAAVAACDPATRVRASLRGGELATTIEGRRRFGLAIGKAALAMARGAGSVERGVIVLPLAAGEAGRGAIDSAAVPPGWRVVASAHPFVDERSVIAARAARGVIDAAGEGDVVLALISGGTSALIEEPIEGLTIEELGAATRAVMESGASIEELNTVRSAMSRVKRGGLVAACKAPVVTLAVSDVIGDGLAIIGSGPTIGAWFGDDEAARRERALALLEGHDRRGQPAAATAPSAIDVARVRRAIERAPRVERRAGASRERDRAIVIATMASFGEAAMTALGPRGDRGQSCLEHVREPLVGDVEACAKRLVELVGRGDAHRTYVAWGEPTLRVPDDHGEGGRAQQLALLFARALRGTHTIAMVIGSDGVDGPPPEGRAAPAGAIVDGETWDAIVAAGHDPEKAIARCDAGTVLEAVGALVVTGPTGINHGDLVVIGGRRG